MLTCRVVCCSHQSDRCIRVYILHQSYFRIRVCISHQSYNSIWISCTNHSVWVLFSCKSDVMESGGCAQRIMLTRNFGLILLVLWFWPLQEPRRVRSVFIGIWSRMKGSHLFSLYNFQVKMCFSASFPPTHMPNNLHSITYCENNVQNAIRTYPIIAPHEH